MVRKLLNPEELHAPPSYSHLAIVDGGEMVFIAGQVAYDMDLQVIGGDDLYAQTVAAMNNVKMAMDAAGVAWDDIVRRTIYTTRPLEVATIASAIRSVTGDSDPPPQTTIGVTGLAHAELLIEIECTAIRS